MKRHIRSLAAFSLLSSGFLFAAPPAATPPPANVQQAERPVLDVVFVLDTTSSMGGLIEGAKQKIWSIASRMASGKPTPRVRVGLVAYRDVGDEYVTKVFALSEDLDTVYKNLMAFQAVGGGDTPESVHTGLSEAVEKMQWSDSKRAAKMIFLVGDAPAHDEDRSKLLAAAKKAISKGVVVNAIRCGTDETAGAQFREVARLADGHFDTIGQQGGVVATVTPFDTDLAKLNGELMDTALYAGHREAQAAGELRRAEAKAMAPSAAADRVGYFSKSAHGSGGLATGASAVGAVDLTEAPEKAAAMKTEDLPAPLQKLSPEERIATAKQQQVKRQELQKQIVELTQKRDDFIATKAKTAPKDSFDSRVFDSVKESASKAGVAY